MRRPLLPLIFAVLLVGCDAAERKADLADKVEPQAAAPAVETGPTTNAAVALPKPPPELPAPVQEVVKLAQTSLSEGVLVDYIGTINEPFTLNADQIIYLNDLGVPMAAIQALLKHQGSDASAVAEVPAAPVPAGPTNAVIAAGLAPANPATAQPVAVMEGQPVPTEAPVAVAQPVTQVTYNTFYESLSPYGSWVEVSGSGWCWRPSVAVIDTGWQPYCDNGSWVWSDCGWYWRSSYSWGWAPFHYGRWHRAPGFGWCWSPGYSWGPAWVTWRSSGAYCGWAPLPPSCGWSVSVGLTWHGGRAAADCDFGLRSDSFVYLGWNRFCDPAPWRHRLSRSEIGVVHAQTRPINDIHGRGNTGVNIVGNNNTVIINNGPGLDPVQKHTRGEITKARLVATSDPTRVTAARGGSAAGILPVYRPTIKAPAAGSRPVPPPTLLARQERGVNSAIAVGPAAVTGRPASTGSVRGEAPIVRGNGAVATSVPPIRDNLNGSIRPSLGGSAPGRSPSVGSPVIVGRSGGGSPTAARPETVQPITGRPNSSVPSSRPATYPGGAQYVRPVTTIPESAPPRYTVGQPGRASAQVSRNEALPPVSARVQPQAPSPFTQPPAYARPAPTYSQPSPSFRSEAARPAPSQPFRSEPVRAFQNPQPNYTAPAPAYRAPAASFTPPVRSYTTPAPSYSPPATRDSGGGQARPAPSGRNNARSN